MASVLVCLPTPPDRWREVCAADQVEGFAATPALREAFGLSSSQDEDAEHAAMVIASVAALSRFGVRHVITAEVDDSLIDSDQSHPDAGNGRVLVPGSALSSSDDPWGKITAWFSDDSSVDVAAAAEAVSDLTLDEAWDHPLVADLIAGHALLWHSVTEWATESEGR